MPEAICIVGTLFAPSAILRVLIKLYALVAGATYVDEAAIGFQLLALYVTEVMLGTETICEALSGAFES